jgi:hypothetical protein
MACDAAQNSSAGRVVANHPPAGHGVGEGTPQAVLLVVVDPDEKAAVVAVDGLLLTGSPHTS